LHQSDAPAPLDGPQAGCTIAVAATEDDPKRSDAGHRSGTAAMMRRNGPSPPVEAAITTIAVIVGLERD
jgi:hypothetical protein